jgi:hypothetical protein
MLHCLEREIAGGEFSAGAADSDGSVGNADLPYRVRPGQTTRVELDVREEAELTGMLRIPGWDDAGWNLWLSPAGAQFGTTARVSGPTEDGRFSVRVRPPGRYRVGVFMEGETSVRSDSAVLQLHPGRQEWIFPAALGSVVLANPRSENLVLELRSSPVPDASSMLRAALLPRSELTLQGVIAGRYQVLLGSGMHTDEVGTLEVQAGATVRFERL